MSVEIPEEKWNRLTSDKKVTITKELFCADLPWGMYNVVPDSFRNALETIDPRWMSHKEETVTRNADPNDMDENFRLSFWTEYNTSKDLQKKFSMERVMSGVCSPFYYKHTILKKPRLMAYIAYPPTNYLLFMKNMLYKGQHRMKEIMSVSAISQVPVMDRVTKEQAVDKNGDLVTKTEIDIKLANMQLKTFALIDNRVKGAIVQKVKIENKNLNVNVDANQILDAAPTTVIDIDKQLQAIDIEMSKTEEMLKNRRALENHSVHSKGNGAIEIEVTNPGYVKVKKQ